MITINGVALKTKRPTDLDQKLIAATGHGAREIESLLASGPDRMANAVLPFLVDDVPDLNKLAADIAADRGAVDAIRTLYANASPDAAPVPADEKGGVK